MNKIVNNEIIELESYVEKQLLAIKESIPEKSNLNDIFFFTRYYVSLISILLECFLKMAKIILSNESTNINSDYVIVNPFNFSLIGQDNAINIFTNNVQFSNGAISLKKIENFFKVLFSNTKYNNFFSNYSKQDIIEIQKIRNALSHPFEINFEQIDLPNKWKPRNCDDLAILLRNIDSKSGLPYYKIHFQIIKNTLASLFKGEII